MITVSLTTPRGHSEEEAVEEEDTIVEEVTTEEEVEEANGIKEVADLVTEEIFAVLRKTKKEGAPITRNIPIADGEEDIGIIETIQQIVGPTVAITNVSNIRIILPILPYCYITLKN